MAAWPSGEATVCKTVNSSSILLAASKAYQNQTRDLSGYRHRVGGGIPVVLSDQSSQFHRACHKTASRGAYVNMRAEAVRLQVASKASNLQPRGMAQEFDQLFIDEYARVVSIAYRVLGDRAEAEDVAQEVFLDFHLRHPNSVSFAPAWLHRAAGNKSLNRIRSRKRREAREAAQEQTEQPGTDTIVEEQEERQLLRDALSRLPSKSATILALRYSGLKYVEIADALSVGVDQVGTLLRRAETLLRKEVER